MKIRKPFLTFLLSLLFISAYYAQDTHSLNPDEIAEKQLDDLDKDVNLDDFQKLELHDFLLENAKKIKTALDNGMDSSDIRFLFENNNRELDSKLKEVLLPEQFERYMNLKRERAINKDKKKEKRKSKQE